MILDMFLNVALMVALGLLAWSTWPSKPKAPRRGPLCIDCAWSKNGGYLGSMCARNVNLVDGEPDTSCTTARLSNGFCGPKGKFFQQYHKYPGY